MAFNSTRNFSRADSAFVSQLIQRELLKPGFKDILKGKDLEQIENYLIEKGLLTIEQIVDEFAEYFDLDIVNLTNVPISPAVARMIPIEIIKQYQVVPYKIEGNNFYLAIGKPSKLQKDAPKIIANIRQQKGLRIHLSLVNPAQLKALIKVLEQRVKQLAMPKPFVPETAKLTKVPSIESVPKTVTPQTKSPEEVKPELPPQQPTVPLQPKTETVKPVEQVKPELKAEPKPQEQEKSGGILGKFQPIQALNKKDLINEVEPRIKHVDLRKLEIPQNIIKKIPQEVASKYRLVVFGETKSGSGYEVPQIKVAVVNPENVHVKEILHYIEQKNKVLVDRYITDEESLTHALKFYPSKPVQAPTQQPTKEAVVTTPPTLTKPKEQTISTSREFESDKPKEQPTPGALKQNKPEDQKTEPAKIPSFKKIPPPPLEGGVTVEASEIINKPNELQNEQLEELASEQTKSLENENLDALIQKEVTSIQELANVYKKGAIPEIIASTIFLAIRMKASDVHLESEKETVRVRYRIDGILHDVLRVPGFLSSPLISRVKILSKMKIDEQRVPQDGRFDVIIDRHQVDIRVSTLPTVHGEKVVMRLLDKSAGILTLEQLGVTGTNFDRLVENIDKPFGIILSTGPTGSGKSTTLYAILNRISKPGVNIVTLEDPVEYELPGINQSQVKPQIGFNFADGLRSVLRQDPNVIMVGEIRDLETAAMATHSALTGHLVLSTLHTNDASGALPRLINMGVEPFLITSSINAVIAQRLVRKICDNCKEHVELPSAVKDFALKHISEIPTGQLKNINKEQLTFYHGKGCAKCSNGYLGRIGIFEVLPMTPGIEALANRKVPASELKNQAIKEGMITMMQDGLIKALKGITTVDEVMRVTTASIRDISSTM
ncbi:Flp pilus assembly complex ATPase component TadA [Candidatus Berkelbacteria bacterium]|nr:Flp pilus assembly complex ATPase component TadA [Candidatus Berkelbacteria bacterium]